MSYQPLVPSFVFPANGLNLPILPTDPSMTTMVASAATYAVTTNFVYLARRSNIRKLSKRKLWQIRTTREPGVSISLFLIMLLAWQSFVFIFPLVEPIAKVCSHVSFFYTYPNAGGIGVILEPLNVQHLSQSQRAKHQIRFDWHRFNLNVGGVGRDGYRHPPSIVMNVPHLDVPSKGLKHWPWRRRRFNKHDQ